MLFHVIIELLHLINFLSFSYMQIYFYKLNCGFNASETGTIIASMRQKKWPAKIRKIAAQFFSQDHLT